MSLLSDGTATRLDDAGTSVSGLNAVTLTAWVYATSLTGGGAGISFICGRETSGNGAAWLRLDGGGYITSLVKTSTDGERTASSNAQISTNVWTHVALTFSGSAGAAVLRNWINGVVQTATYPGMTGPTDNGGADFHICDSFFTGRMWKGELAEIGAWNVELTADEIASLASGFSCYRVRPQSSIGYWPCDDSKFKNIVRGTIPTVSAGTAALGTTHPRVY
jgi:hypothetical protein